MNGCCRTMHLLVRRAGLSEAKPAADAIAFPAALI
jgi:hypothetical protein